MPERIQRSRKRGWRLPEGAVVVSRPTRWGNPYVVHRHSAACDMNDHLNCPVYSVDSREDAVRMYRHAVLYPLHGQPKVPTPDEIRAELTGRDLACFCPLGQPCHADFLLLLANEEVADGRA